MAKTMGFAMPDEMRERLGQEAEGRGTIPSELVRQGLDLILNMDPAIMREVDKVAGSLDVSRGLVLENVFIGWLARRQAWMEIRGATNSMFEEFLRVGDETLRGEALLKRLRGGYCKEFERSANLQRAASARQAGMVPRDLDIDDQVLGGVVKLLEDGILTTEEFREQLEDLKGTTIEWPADPGNVAQPFKKE